MTTETPKRETYSEMMHRGMIEYEAHKNDPKPPETTCKNCDCPLYEKCNHNIWTDGLKCDGNKINYFYKSAQVSIYGDYLKKCEASGETPMSRFHYFEF